jgi:hypothetical protein
MRAAAAPHTGGGRPPPSAPVATPALSPAVRAEPPGRRRSAVGNAATGSTFFPTRQEVAMQIPLPLAIALVAATYGVIAVAALPY